MRQNVTGATFSDEAASVIGRRTLRIVRARKLLDRPAAAYDLPERVIGTAERNSPLRKLPIGFTSRALGLNVFSLANREAPPGVRSAVQTVAARVWRYVLTQTSKETPYRRGSHK